MPTLIRAASTDKVWFIDNGQRRWVKDDAGVLSLGGWGRVRELPEQEVMALPEGEPWLSATPPTPPTAPTPANEDVLVIRPASRVSPLTGPVAPMQRPDLVVSSGDVDLGDVWMATTARLNRATGQIKADTRTWTKRRNGGTFRGGLYAICSDAGDLPRMGANAAIQRYEVKAPWLFGSGSTRLVGWPDWLQPADAQRARHLRVFLTSRPDELQGVLNRWVDADETVSQLVADTRLFARQFTNT